jgi:hypothetical protein
MRTRPVVWVAGITLALALGASACGEEDGVPGPADPAVAGAPAEVVAPGQPIAGAADPATPPDQPAVPPATPRARPSPGSLASSNWYPNPPPCRDCPVTPAVPVAVDPALPAPAGPP